jgi:tRNA1(Val) A37 N6-methylase TrmN6
MSLGPLKRDGVCRGLLDVWQPARGYRYNLDSVLLAALCAGDGPHGMVVDAGAGCGVMGLYLAKAGATRVLLLERQPPFAALCARNARENRLPGVHVVVGDFREMPVPSGLVSALVSNPPYLVPGTGRQSPVEHRRLCREAVHGGAQEVVMEAGRVLAPAGRLYLVGPLPLLDRVRVPVLHRVRVVRLAAREGCAPDRALAVFSRQPGSCREETRAVHLPGGGFAPWVAEVLEGRRRSLGP